MSRVRAWYKSHSFPLHVHGSTLRPIFGNLAILALSTALAVGCSEIGLRYLYPHASLGSGVSWSWSHDTSSILVSDSEIGFRPQLNTEVYDNHGILLVRSYKHAAVAGEQQIILFIGDSVTARSRIVDGIDRQLGNVNVEFLNGGVESFNLTQEVSFFLKYQSGLRIDRIIHQVHGNDLQATPIAFRDETGALNVYALNSPKQYVNQWLFQNSYLYRLALAVLVAHRTEASTADEARTDFDKMVGYARSHNIRYDVVLFPILSPQSDLSPQERRDWNILETSCNEIVSHCVSLLPVLSEMLAQGQSGREAVGDNWHPNQAFADIAATLIIQSLGLSNLTTLQPSRGTPK